MAAQLFWLGLRGSLLCPSGEPCGPDPFPCRLSSAAQEAELSHPTSTSCASQCYHRGLKHALRVIFKFAWVFSWASEYFLDISESKLMPSGRCRRITWSLSTSFLSKADIWSVAFPHKDLWWLLIYATSTLASTSFPWHLPPCALPQSSHTERSVCSRPLGLLPKVNDKSSFFDLVNSYIILKTQTGSCVLLDVSPHCTFPGDFTCVTPT